MIATKVWRKSGKRAITRTYRRPKKLIIAKSTFTGVNVKYLRNAKEAINLGSGLDLESRGALSILVDLMMIHEGQGIPANPPSYIAGMLGIGQRKWTQTIEPALLGAHKLRKTRRSGMDVYVWADPDLASGGARALGEVVDSAEPAHEMPRPVELRARLVPTHRKATAPPQPERQAALPIERPEPRPVMPPAEDTRHVVPLVTSPMPPEQAAADLVPMPSAYDVLKRAGLSPDDHPRGEFYWLRSEHQATLRRWLAAVPLSEIVVRLDKARLAGRLPKEQPNSLDAFEAIVMEGT